MRIKKFIPQVNKSNGFIGEKKRSKSIKHIVLCNNFEFMFTQCPFQSSQWRYTGAGILEEFKKIDLFDRMRCSNRKLHCTLGEEILAGRKFGGIGGNLI